MSKRNLVFVILALIAGVSYILNVLLAILDRSDTGPILIKSLFAFLCLSYAIKKIRNRHREPKKLTGPNGAVKPEEHP